MISAELSADRSASSGMFVQVGKLAMRLKLISCAARAEAASASAEVRLATRMVMVPLP